MNFTVFYSWQSDIENKYNRSFIEDALEKAAKNISNDTNYSLEAVVDRDTYGIPGSPSIVESITAKIAKSDVFVCDVSIINSKSEKRQMPNPNVLFELGYASAILGWDRIIMVQNIAFGDIDKLPFDLRGRRILQYCFNATNENKAEEKQNLRERLIFTFNDALKYYKTNSFNGLNEKIVWWGNWEIDSKIKMLGGHLHIGRVSSDAFFFEIVIFHGARTGNICGKAQILTPHSAYAVAHILDDKKCEIVFKRRLLGDSWCIEVEAGPDCKYYHGLGATFSGIYKHKNELLINYGYLDEIDLNEIERLLGEYLPAFLRNFQIIHACSDENNNELTIVTGGVKGMYTIMGSIIALDKRGSIWGAFLDTESNVIRYFTNVSSEIAVTPVTIKEWLSKFSNRQIVVTNRPM